MKKPLAIAVALLFVLAAAGWAEDWFDAYARGLEALKQGNGARAAEWLERAIRKHPEPGTNILTYGTNRLDRYHPYLALAEAYLQAGQPEAAREALERAPSRAREPAAERERLAARVNAELSRTRAAAPTAPPTAAPSAIAAATAAPTLVPTSAPVAAIPLAASAAPPAAVATPGLRRPAAGRLAVESDPAGATVLLGARFVGHTPLEIEVAPGVYDVTLRREGAAEQRFPVEVRAGQRSAEARALVLTATPAPTTAAAATGSIAFVTQPPGVSVYVDDVPLGTTDPASGRLTKSGLAPGPHHVRLSYFGHADIAEDVMVTAGDVTGVHRTLLRRGGSAGMWIAIAMGAAAVGLFLFRLLRRAAAPSAEADRTRAEDAPTVAHGALSSQDTPVDALETQAVAVPARGGAGTKVNAGRAQFGDYRLLEQLGKGGMASVFKAERRGEICALKRPLGGLLEDPEFLERFMREAEIGRTLHHPNIIRILERGSVDDVPYFTMELVQGETLQEHVRQRGALDARAATRVVAQVAEALDYAHLKGVVHRDLKPSNIMILRDGTVKVMDYGIARARRFEGLTLTGAFLGTPDYVAPETAEGRSTDARSDLYSLGVVFYEILTGRRPFHADTPFATLKKHCTEPPAPPSTVNAAVPKEVEAIVLKLLSKDPDDRHPSAEELLIELREFLNRAAA